MHSLIEPLRSGLIVSCQAYPGEPLRHPETMAQVAAAVTEGGALAVRAQGLADVQLVSTRVDVPTIGIWKDGESGVFITPTLRHAQAVIATGAALLVPVMVPLRVRAQPPCDRACGGMPTGTSQILESARGLLLLRSG